MTSDWTRRGTDEVGEERAAVEDEVEDGITLVAGEEVGRRGSRLGGTERVVAGWDGGSSSRKDARDG
ncbi:hypothetical protein Pmani_036815 [Petrolisthes manimaculis]|uniref:Uncharacterized protein n=1 Tax=Petrolisthes manimaculis TaxID=1843537 RepID=A0AAE1NJE5_9EUCA|nr:hypothetical protein Pmani_036815 [Petrolisthes manimaculis]